MYKELLGQFLDENKPSNELPSAAVLTHFNLKTIVIPEGDKIRNTLDSLYGEPTMKVLGMGLWRWRKGFMAIRM